MAFSNSFPSVGMGSSSGEFEIEKEISMSRQTGTENTWASVPTLSNSSDGQLLPSSGERSENTDTDTHTNTTATSERKSDHDHHHNPAQSQNQHSASSHIANLIDLEDCPDNESALEEPSENMEKYHQQPFAGEQELFEFAPKVEPSNPNPNSTPQPSKCDLISQCQLDKINQENQNDMNVAPVLAPGLDKMERNNMMMVSSFDDNGNPLNFEAVGGGGGGAINVNVNHHQYQHAQHHHNIIHPHPHQHQHQHQLNEANEILMENKPSFDASNKGDCQNNERGERQPQQQQDEQLPASAMSMSKSSGSETNNKLTVSSEETSEKGEVTNQIKLGFKSNLQKSVEGFMEECKYFINAAALSEDIETFAMPSLESDFGDDEQQQQHPEDQSTNNRDRLVNTNNTNPHNKKEQDSVSYTNAANDNNISSQSIIPTVMVKPRVPISKSFPDIIQTHCFVEDDQRDGHTNKDYSSSTLTKGKLVKADTMKDQSTGDLAADSLEELPTKPIPEFEFDTSKGQEKLTQYDFKGNKVNEGKLQELMDMSQSQSQIGILSEDPPIFPPESWIIDFNSLSMESESCLDNSEMSSSIKSSNPNSLAFFIDIEEPSESSNKAQAAAVKSPDKKKIFSMFVDLKGEGESTGKYESEQFSSSSSLSSSQHHGHSQSHGHGHGSVNKPSRLPVHRNVMNIIRGGDPSDGYSHQHNNPGSPSLTATYSNTHQGSASSSQSSSSSSKNRRTFQYPSPILQHKAAAEAARQAVTQAGTGNPEVADKVGSKTTGNNNPAAGSDRGQNKNSGNRDEHTATASGVSCNSNSGSCNSSNNMEASTTSNRSSLHVATDLDMMAFSTSFISSMEVSGPEAEEICSKGPCFKLGKDLLRMFQDGINTDVSICVNGRYLNAHKCILSSRSQYFAAIFSGPWIEKAGNVITLDGFSYNVVHFTMCHIYSGTNEIPDSIDLLELATLTDLLGLEGLRENISQTIRVKFCHNFHRPCTGCISGVLECFPIAISYEMDELHRKMTKWICKHFVRIWPTKAFANLGDELIEKCLRYSVNHLSVENILDITLGCDQLLTTMPSVRWSEPIFSVVNQLSEACVQFIGENFSQVLQCQRFLLFGKGQQWNISRIEGTFTEAMALLKPDEACLSHTALSRLIELGTDTIDEVEWSTMFVDFLKMLRAEVERFLIANGSKAVLSKYWEHLGQDVRKRICTSSFVGYDKQGNKIVKGATTGTGSSSGGSGTGVKPSAAHGHGRLTPSDRSSSISSVKSSSSTKTRRAAAGAATDKNVPSSNSHSNEAVVPPSSSSTSNYATAKSSTARIASVRPIQNVLSTTSSTVTTPTTSELQLPPPTASATGTMPKQSSKASSSVSHKSSSNTSTRQRGEVVVKEKSFSQSPRNSVASSSSTSASANRTPLNPLTPMTPSKPGPGLIGATSTRSSSRTSAAKQQSIINNTAPSNQTPPKTYMTNSARANAVSKPNLRQKSVSAKTAAECNTNVIAPAANTSTTSRYTTPRTPNLSQPSRYASSLGHNRNSRGSISGSDTKSERASAVTTPIEPQPRTSGGSSSSSSRNTSGRATHVSSTSSNSTMKGKSVSVSKAGTTTNISNRNSSGSSSSSRKTSGKTSTGGNGALHHQTTSSKTPSYNMEQMDPYRDSSIMSKSTIEMDTGEPKMRTLAEIGRSSTFSKDEPTILGKLDLDLDPSLNIDFTT